MSCKMSLNNSIKLNSDGQQWVKTSSIDSNVKLAGEEAKDRLYEPKHKKKLVRVLTVVAYVFFVSLAAIMLSLYYVIFWNGNSKDVGSRQHQSMDTQYSNRICNQDIPYPTPIPVLEATTPTPDSIYNDDEDEKNIAGPTFQSNFSEILPELTKQSVLIKKILDNSIE